MSAPGPVDPDAKTVRLGVDDANDDTAKTQRPKANALPRGTAVGRYLLVDLIGEGGMGAVYSAYDPDLGRKVAVKLLKADGRGPEWSRDRLLREAQAMARLSHPNVLPVYDTGTFADRVFVAMEFVDGVTLTRWLGREPRAAREILQVFLAAGEGLAAAHAAGLTHRDFKPDNVLVGGDGRPRVADFGLAHLEAAPSQDSPLPAPSTASTSRSTLAGTLSGTPAYMAPEQFKAGATDARTDQFSFCVALWEALTGRPPFGSGDFFTLRQAVLEGKVAPPARPLPRALHAALLKGLALEPADRFATMQDLLAQLRKDPARRLRRTALAASSAVLLTAILGATGWSLWRERTRCARESARELEALWGPARRAEVERAVAAVPGAGRILSELDQHLSRWAAQRREACQAVQRGDERRRAAVECLARYGITADATAAALASPGIDDSAEALLDALGPPERCLGSRKAAAATTRSPEIYRQVAELRILIDRARPKEALEVAQALLPRLRAQNALAAASEVQEHLARAMLTLHGTSEEALELLRQGVRDADASGDDEESFRARLSLVEALNRDFNKAAEANAVALDLEAWVRRLGEPAYLKHSAARIHAEVLSSLGRHEEAMEQFRLAIRLGEEIPLAQSFQAAVNFDYGTALAAAGRYAEAEVQILRSMTLLETAAWIRPYDRIVALVNLGVMRAHLGRLPESLEALEKASALLEHAPDLESLKIWADYWRGRVLLEQHRPDEAETLLQQVVAKPVELDVLSHAGAQAGLARVFVERGQPEKALAAAEKALAEDDGSNAAATGYIRFSLAQALRASGKDPARSVDLAKQALGAFEGPENGFRRGQIEKWLAEAEKKAP